MPDRIYAIGDIHGHLDRLRSVHHWIDADRAIEGGDDVVVHLGDLMDRGPDSAGVLDFLIDGLLTGQRWVVLKGNHDRMMSLFLENPMQQDHKLRSEYNWLSGPLGGLTTLASYGIDTDVDNQEPLHDLAVDAVPASHKAFLLGLNTTFRTKDAVFVHAGIRPGVAIEKQVEDDLIWIREPFLSDTTDHGPLIIHGHTPVETPTHYGNRINIDSGVAFGGPLSVIVVEGRKVWNLKSSGREALLSTSTV